MGMRLAVTLVAARLVAPSFAVYCCWSSWGDASQCGNYPAGASGGRCSNDVEKTCVGPSDCDDAAPPTPAPTPAPTHDPMPIVPTPAPTPPTEPPVAPTPAPLPPADGLLGEVIRQLEAADSEGVFVYEDALGQKIPSDVYTWRDMITAVHLTGSQGIGEDKLWVGEGERSDYGMVNIAAFLAQAMQETIRYNACDENNWSDKLTQDIAGSGEVYPATAACGQLGQSYQDYKCSEEEDALAGGKMACDVDPLMMKRASTQAHWFGGPPKLFCAPKALLPQAPKWGAPWCAPEGGWGHVDPFPDDVDFLEYIEYVKQGGSCKDYQDIKQGGWEFCNGAGCANSDAPNFGRPEGRTDVEGCCWWGRGVIQTTGTCNFGKLNFFLGKRAASEGRDAMYPEIDFCRDPDMICDPSGPKELKWVAGIFYWLNVVQPYQHSDGWNYLNELKNWVDAGMPLNDWSFLDGASGIVNRGCYNPDCGTGELHARQERRDNFLTVLRAMKMGGLLREHVGV